MRIGSALAAAAVVVALPRHLVALGIVKPEKRNDIRIRMTLSDAREIVEHDTMPANVKNRIRYALWQKK